ncbi:tetratricopeptide repeat protein [Sulfuricurvum sp.]|uniref:tetratricopeptide repeat protein n=1 Tax=Sulfuricurvum sp. TaxID=2025608 RepID=UPI003568099E
MKKRLPIMAIALACSALSPLSATDISPASFNNLTTLAKEYEKQGKIEEAIQVYRHILELDPNQTIISQAINRLSQKKEPSKKTSTTSSLQKSTKKNVQIVKITQNSAITEETKHLLIKQGFQALEENDVRNAQLYFDQVLKARPKNGDARYGKAIILSKQNNWNDVIKLLEPISKKYHRQDISDLYEMALTESKKLKESIEPVQTVEILKSLKNTTEPIKASDADMKNAIDAISKNELEQAASILQTLYIKNPMDINVLLRLGEVYSRMNKYNIAQEYYQTALSSSPKNSLALIGSANTYIAQKKYKNALVTFEKLDRTKWNSDVEYTYQSAKIAFYLEQKEYEKGWNSAKQLHQLQPNRIETIRLLGAVGEHIYPEEAIYYRSLAYRQSNSIGDFISLVYALLSENRFSQAETYFNTLTQKSLSAKERESLKALYLTYYKKLSSFQLEQKEFVSAENTLRSGLLIANDADLIENLGWSLFHQNKTKEALEQFEILLQQQPSANLFYAGALSSHILKDDKKAFSYLLLASKTKDILLLQKIAELYLQMGYKQESLDTIHLIEELEHNSSTSSKKQSINTLSTSKSPSLSQDTYDYNGIYNPFISSDIGKKPTLLLNIPSNDTKTSPQKEYLHQFTKFN